MLLFASPASFLYMQFSVVAYANVWVWMSFPAPGFLDSEPQQKRNSDNLWVSNDVPHSVSALLKILVIVLLIPGAYLFYPPLTCLLLSLLGLELLAYSTFQLYLILAVVAQQMGSEPLCW